MWNEASINIEDYALEITTHSIMEEADTTRRHQAYVTDEVPPSYSGTSTHEYTGAASRPNVSRHQPTATPLGFRYDPFFMILPRTRKI